MELMTLEKDRQREEEKGKERHVNREREMGKKGRDKARLLEAEEEVKFK